MVRQERWRPPIVKPWMDPDDIAILEEIMRSYASAGRPLDVLEWGSGGSTLLCSELLHKLGARFRWHSVEHHQSWNKRVGNEAKSLVKEGKIPEGSVTVHLTPLNGNGNVYVALPWIDGDPKELADVPESAIKRQKFDVVIVDGRYRRRCVIRARKLLKPNGILLLHDAERAWYRCAMDRYEHQAKLTTKKKEKRHMWAACLDPALVPFRSESFS